MGDWCSSKIAGIHEIIRLSPRSRNLKQQQGPKGAPNMRNTTMLALALASTTLAASPAAATTDNAGYVGIEAGLWFPNDTDVDFDANVDFYDVDLELEHKMGFDGDLIGGYDFGAFRVEAELAYKTADIDEVTADFGDGEVEVD